MPRAGLSRQAVIDLAVATLDEGGATGFDQLTLAAVAARAGVAVPSLYKHVAGLPDLRRGVALVAVRGLTAAVEAAAEHDHDHAHAHAHAHADAHPHADGRTDTAPGADGAGSATDALARTADAVRGYAHRFPGRYAATQVAPDATDPASAELLAANAEAVRAIAAALRPVTGSLAGAGLVHTVRAVRSAIHGFVTLEQRGGFGLPEDLDDSFGQMIAILQAGLAGVAEPGSPPGRDQPGRDQP